MPTAPNSPLSEGARELPGLLAALRAALEPGADNQAQAKAFRLGCKLLEKLVDSMQQDLHQIEEARNLMTGFEISIPSDQFQEFIDGEIDLMKPYGFSGQDLDDVRHNLSGIKGDLNDLRLDSSEAVRALQEFGDLLCQLETLAAAELIPDAKGLELVQVCIFGIIDVGMICVDVVEGGAALATGWLGLPVVLMSLSSLKTGYLNLRKAIPKVHELIAEEIQRRKVVREQRILKELAAKTSLSPRSGDKK